VDHVVEVLAADHAVVTEHGSVGGAGAGQRTGMRGGGAAAGIGAADLGND